MKHILLIVGFMFLFIGYISVFSSINLLYYGYTFKEYINYIIKTPEFIYLVFGFIILNIWIFIKGAKNAKNM